MVTVDKLKLQYATFKVAKDTLGIKAGSWQKLADKINLANGTTSQKTQPEPAANLETIVRDLKKKYGKLALAKTAMQVKANSWLRLAELYLAA